MSGVLYIPFIHSRHNAKDRSLRVGRDITLVVLQLVQVVAVIAVNLKPNALLLNVNDFCTLC